MRILMGLVVMVSLSLSIIGGAAAKSPDWLACEGKDPDRSIHSCTKLIKAGRQSGTYLVLAYFYRGVAHGEKGRHEQAIADFNRAIKLYPEAVDAYYNRGTAYYNMGQYDRAIADLNHVLKLTPNDAIALQYRGDSYNGRAYQALRAGHGARALADFSLAVEDAPKSAGIRHSLGEGYFYAGEEKKARQVWGRACALASIKKVMDWQKKLVKAGHFAGKIDGICSPAITTAFASCARAKCKF